MEQTRVHTVDTTAGQATQGNSTWRTGMAGLFALFFVRGFAVFHPWKNKMFHFYTLIEVNCTFWEPKPTAKIKHETLVETFRA